MRDPSRSALGAGLLSAALLAFAVPSASAQNPCALDARDTLAQANEESGVGGSGFGDESGMGGSGFGDEGSGMGGSGAADERGIGGSGLLGTITGFASLCVNGVEVQTQADTPVGRWGRTGDTEQLAVGQLVWIEATGRAGALHAERIDVLTAAAGTISELDPRGGSIRIDEQWIDLAPNTLFFDALTGAATSAELFQPGSFAVVSGLPTADGRILASRIERSTPDSGARADLVPLSVLLERSPRVRVVWIEGHFVQQRGSQRFRLGGVEADLGRPTTDPLPAIAIDTRVLVRGTVDSAGEIAVDAVSLMPERTTPLSPERPQLADPDGPDLGTEAPSLDAPPRPDVLVTPEKPELPVRPSIVDRPMKPDLPVRPERPVKPVRPDSSVKPSIRDLR